MKKGTGNESGPIKTDVRPANGHEDLPSAALLLQLEDHYPDLQVNAVAGDSGFVFDAFLHTIYAHLHTWRVVDRRCHDTNRNKEQWATHGYDDHGRPVCSPYYFDCPRKHLKV